MQATMTRDVAFSINSLRFDDTYTPADSTRLTTNFANLARGESRQENLRNALQMIDNRFNDLAHWDNPTRDRYTVELDIISVEMEIAGEATPFPAIEILKTFPDEESRRLAAVYMDGLSLLRSEWLLEKRKLRRTDTVRAPRNSRNCPD